MRLRCVVTFSFNKRPFFPPEGLPNGITPRRQCATFSIRSRFKLGIVAPQLIIGPTEKPFDSAAFNARDDGVSFPLRLVPDGAREARDQQQLALFANAPLHVRVDPRLLVPADLEQRGAIRAREIHVLRIGYDDGVGGLIKKVDPLEDVLTGHFGFAHLASMTDFEVYARRWCSRWR